MPRGDDFEEESRLARKSREAPMMLIGLAGLLIVCGVGVHKFRHRGTMPVSQFLMQLRVAAQGTVVAALTMGAVYSMATSLVKDPEKREEKKSSKKSVPPK